MTTVPDRDLTENLREFALERLNVHLIGVASVQRLAEGPEGGRPTDYMPEARAVVVLASAIPRGVLEVAGHYDEPGKTLGPYMWYGYPILNWELSSSAARVAGFLEMRGFKGLPFPPTGLNYRYGNRADFSHRHAAVAAGLGEFGYSGLLLTPQFGPGQRVVSIVTDAPLEPSPMYDGPSLCRPEVCGRACIKACPTRAMTGEVSLTIGGRTFSYARLHSVRCKWQFPEKGYRRTKVPMPADPTEEDHRVAMATTQVHPFDVALHQYTFVPQCGACIFRCPSPRFADG
jgi:epoxyqueuosine reductase QueG